MVLPCNMFALDGKFAGFPRAPIVEFKAPCGIGDCDVDRPGRGAKGGKVGDLWPSPMQWLLDEVDRVGLPVFLDEALAARSSELRNIADFRLMLSKNILEDGMIEEGGSPVLISRPEIPWLG